MPSFIGGLFIENNTGSINTGDFNNVSPKFAEKSYHGQGSSIVGDLSPVFNGINATNTLDADLLDQDQVLGL